MATAIVSVAITVSNLRSSLQAKISNCKKKGSKRVGNKQILFGNTVARKAILFNCYIGAFTIISFHSLFGNTHLIEERDLLSQFRICWQYYVLFRIANVLCKIIAIM